MKIVSELTDRGVQIVSLTGRMSLADLQEIETRLKALVIDKPFVIIDLTHLNFLFSMCLRTLIICAQAAEARGDRLVLLAPTENILTVLKASGVSLLVPVYTHLSQAEAALFSKPEV